MNLEQIRETAFIDELQKIASSDKNDSHLLRNLGIGLGSAAAVGGGVLGARYGIKNEQARKRAVSVLKRQFMSDFEQTGIVGKHPQMSLKDLANA